MDLLTILIAFLSACGLSALLWLCLGRFVLPVGVSAPVQVSLIAGPELEQTLRGLEWLSSAGLLHASVTVLDVGLLPQERAETLRLLRRWPGILLEPPAEQ